MCTTLLIKTIPDTKQAATGVSGGAVVSGRTMEFGFDVRSKIIVIPKGTKLTPTLPGDTKMIGSTKPGEPYVTKFGMVGANALDLDVVVDGLNECGLYFSALYFPRYAEYPDVPVADGRTLLAPYDLGAYLLGGCETVKDVKDALKNVALVNTVVADLKGPPPLHFIVRDVTGECLVIEPLNGQLKTYDNPVGVMTNSPPFDWMMINLINYRGLHAENTPTVVLGGGHELPLFGQGSGMFGLPGDSTPPSRFVRAVAYSQTALPVVTAQDAVLQVFHIMNAFDIPKGSITETHPGEDSKPPVVHCDYTIWTVVADLNYGQFYFRTYNDQTIRRIDVGQTLEAANGVIRYIEMDSPQPIVEVTTQFLAAA